MKRFKAGTRACTGPEPARDPGLHGTRACTGPGRPGLQGDFEVVSLPMHTVIHTMTIRYTLLLNINPSLQLHMAQGQPAPLSCLWSVAGQVTPLLSRRLPPPSSTKSALPTRAHRHSRHELPLPASAPVSLCGPGLRLVPLSAGWRRDTRASLRGLLEAPPRLESVPCWGRLCALSDCVPCRGPAGPVPGEEPAGRAEAEQICSSRLLSRQDYSRGRNRPGMPGKQQRDTQSQRGGGRRRPRSCAGWARSRPRLHCRTRHQ